MATQSKQSNRATSIVYLSQAGLRLTFFLGHLAKSLSKTSEFSENSEVSLNELPRVIFHVPYGRSHVCVPLKRLRRRLAKVCAAFERSKEMKVKLDASIHPKGGETPYILFR
jgi:hypothetical protein